MQQPIMHSRLQFLNSLKLKVFLKSASTDQDVDASDLEATGSNVPLGPQLCTPRDAKDDAIPGPSTECFPNLVEDLALSDDSDADPHYVPMPQNSSSTDDDNLPTHEENNTVVTETRKKGRSRIQRAECKKLRNSGKSYVTEKGKIVSERKLVPLKPCRMKCDERIKEKDREICFQNYWNLGSRNKRASYIGSLITIKMKKTQTTRADPQRNRSCSCSYEVIINNQRVPVCRLCFQSIFGETKGFVQLVLQKKNNSPCGMVKTDSRGLAPPKNKKTPEELQDVKNHILSFPSHESHYCRNRINKKFLSSDLSISRMYGLYKENRGNPVCLTIYSQCFHELGLSFKKPKLDTYHKCDVFDAKIKVANDVESAELKAQKDKHLEMADYAYAKKK